MRKGGRASRGRGPVEKWGEGQGEGSSDRKGEGGGVAGMSIWVERTGWEYWSEGPADSV